MDNLRITRETADDIFEVNELVYITWLDTYPNAKAGILKEDIEEKFKHRNDIDHKNKVLENFKNRKENIHSLVAKMDNKIVGYCRIITYNDYDQLQMIYILPAYQHMGIGSALWDKAKADIIKNSKVIVQVATYNTKAISFYKKLGFSDNGKRWTDPKLIMPISSKGIPEMEMEM